uniref:Uncharacterized protein n=1 Tax=Panagrolaimus davidi TaxID=227884 RepID=A0A914Q749_9BILA
MSSNDLPEIDEEFFEELEKLGFQEKQLKLDEKNIYDQDFINQKKKKNAKNGLNLAEKEISDQDFIDPMEALDIQQRLKLAENEISRLKTELKIKEDLIENLLRPIYAKILEKEKEGGNLSELLFGIKVDISKALNRPIENPSFSSSNGNSSPTLLELRHMRRAVVEAQDKPERLKNVVLNFKQLSGDTIDSFINELIDFCEFNGITFFTPANQFQWHGKLYPMLIMKFDSRETAINVTKAATEIQKSAERYQAISVRQDYSSSELKLISLLWDEVNERNNKDGLFAWTVINFRIVKRRRPGPWINKPLNENF